MWKNKHVRDLSWLLKSAPILEKPGSELRNKWCQSQFSESLFNEHLPWLQDLDEQSDEINRAMQGADQQLLGKHYEQLFKFFLTKSPYFELKTANVQINRQGITRAEIDFLARYISTSEWIHFEISCKYYLGAANSSDYRAWIGPNGNDNLSERMEKFKKQLSVQETILDEAETDQMRSLKARSLGWLKGFLFVPFHLIGNHKLPKGVSSFCPVGWYIKSNSIHFLEDTPAQWLVLPRHEWISPWETAHEKHELMNGHGICSFLKKHFDASDKAMMVVQLDPLSNYTKELSRGFVVHKNWPNVP
jgi:hypothetical protein